MLLEKVTCSQICRGTQLDYRPQKRNPKINNNHDKSGYCSINYVTLMHIAVACYRTYVNDKWQIYKNYTQLFEIEKLSVDQ
jgi:hypothetical protein